MEPVKASPGIVQVRPARPADIRELEAMIDRCSPETRFRRFHGVFGEALRQRLPDLLAQTDRTRSWVAAEGTLIHGFGTLSRAEGQPAEASFLVEDAWFRRGLGTALFDAIAREVRRSDTAEVVAFVQGDNVAARRFLRQAAPGARATFAGAGELEIALPVRAVPRVSTVVTPSIRETA